MKRKYDLRNKRNFIIIFGVALIVIIIFSLFVYRYQQTKKIGYTVDSQSIVQDTSKNYIVLNDDAILKMHPNKNYYLDYQDNKINLSKRVIVYNTMANSLKLYGKFYEITAQGKVILNDGEVVLDNLGDTKFYKLADREYLLVDKNIVSQDRSIEANNYLLVELDKMGNAKLTNNILNLKTVAPTKLVTSKYVFDIANETLRYNKLDIDLKKIIGTTNQYKEDTLEEKENDKNDTPTNTGGNNNAGANRIEQVVNNNTNVADTVVDNTTDNSKEVTIDELKDKVKTTSVIKPTVSLTQIDIDYVVYDPYDEYKQVYAEIEKSGKIEVIHLSKKDTHMTIPNLTPDTEYKINFIYTTVDSESNEIKPNKFEELKLKTLKPVYSGSISKYSGYKHKLTYGVNLYPGFSIDSITVTIKYYYQLVNDEGVLEVKERSVSDTITVSGTSTPVYGVIDTTGYDLVDLEHASVQIVSVSSNGMTINY